MSVGPSLDVKVANLKSAESQAFVHGEGLTPGGPAPFTDRSNVLCCSSDVQEELTYLLFTEQLILNLATKRWIDNFDRPPRLRTFNCITCKSGTVKLFVKND